MTVEPPVSPPEGETVAETAPKPEDQILFWCGRCGQKYRLPAHLAGKAGVCAKCKSYLFIPLKSQTEPVLNRTIVFPCKYCGSKLRKSRALAGTEIKCGKCGGKNLVPEKSKLSSLSKPGAGPEDLILFWCGYCGQKYRLPRHLAGKPGTCDRCHNPLQIPRESQFRPELKKTIVFLCEHCGQKQWCDPRSAGTKIHCGKCGGEIVAPEKSTVLPFTKTGAVPENLILFWCSYCGQKYRLPRCLAGKTGLCDNCQNDLFIPYESQAEPELKPVIVFACEHCGRKLWKAETLAGTEVECNGCGKKIVIPEKSKKSLIQRIAPVKLRKTFIVTEQTRTNLVVVGRAPGAWDTSTEERLTNEKELIPPPEFPPDAAVPAPEPAVESPAATQFNLTTDTMPRIVITENPPVIHQVQNYFQQKAEKHFLFALSVVFIDYLVHLWEIGRRRPSKAFVIFSTVMAILMVLTATWNHIMAEPPSRTSKCRYHLMCTECGYREIRRFENIAGQTCSKCGQAAGLTYRCRNCKRYFAFDEAEKRAERQRRDPAGKSTGKKTLFSTAVTLKCPYCHSEDVYYVTVREAEAKKKTPGNAKTAK